jgi:hypothetical protein
MPPSDLPFDAVPPSKESVIADSGSTEKLRQHPTLRNHPPTPGGTYPSEETTRPAPCPRRQCFQSQDEPERAIGFRCRMSLKRKQLGAPCPGFFHTNGSRRGCARAGRVGRRLQVFPGFPHFHNLPLGSGSIRSWPAAMLPVVRYCPISRVHCARLSPVILAGTPGSAPRRAASASRTRGGTAAAPPNGKSRHGPRPQTQRSRRPQETPPPRPNSNSRFQAR